MLSLWAIGGMLVLGLMLLASGLLLKRGTVTVRERH
jgi:hypothetical protein